MVGDCGFLCFECFFARHQSETNQRMCFHTKFFQIPIFTLLLVNLGSSKILCRLVSRGGNFLGVAVTFYRGAVKGGDLTFSKNRLGGL